MTCYHISPVFMSFYLFTVKPYLDSKIGHWFGWEILMPAPKDKGARKNLEAFFIAVQKPLLYEQVKLNVFSTFFETASHEGHF